MTTVSTPDEPVDREKKLQELAYQLWEAEGRLDGQADRHWFLAIQMLETGIVGMLPGVPVDDPHWLKRNEGEQVSAAVVSQPVIAASERSAEEPQERLSETEIERRMKKSGVRAI